MEKIALKQLNKIKIKLFNDSIDGLSSAISYSSLNNSEKLEKLLANKYYEALNSLLKFI